MYEEEMKKMKFIFTTLLVVLLSIVSGCATTPVRHSDAIKAPQDRVLSYQTINDKATSTIVITRDEGFLGGGCYYAVFINTILAARLNPAETVNFYVEPGEIMLKVGRDPQGKGLCAVGQDEWTQRETIMRPHETKYFRLTIDVNGKTDIQRAD
jgi:hypothetical protein